LVRAPERLVFKVDVGNMPVPKAEEYIKKLMQQYWTRKNFDSSQGRIGNVYDPQSMLDAYWFTKRGQSEGTTVEQLAGGCLDMNTKIPLLDGRTLSLVEMTKEYQEGKQNWVYSCNPENGHIVPGKVSWAGVTHKSAKVLKLTFDNQKELICTLDHKFPVIGKGKTEAKDLSVGDSIYPLNRQKQKISKRTSEYEQVYQHDTKEWEYTHRVIANNLKIDTFISDKNNIRNNKFTTIHHKNFNRFDNTPDNLCYMNYWDHLKMHSLSKTDIIKQNISDGVKEWYKTLTPNERYARGMVPVTAAHAAIKNMSDDQKRIYKEKLRISSSKRFDKMPGLKKQIADGAIKTWQNEEIRTKRIKSITAKWQDPAYRKKMMKHRGLNYTEESLRYLIDIMTKYNVKTYTDIIKYLSQNTNSKFNQQFIEDNKNICWKGKITENNLRCFIKHHGYESFKQFKDEIRVFNHRITKIEYLDEPIEVGTLTIDQNEDIHNYHTFATGCGVMTYNSNLGQLDDLMYFVKKLYKSLKVPVTRLDPADPFKDGTEITREELRFAKFIIRIQGQIAQGFKQSFITHLQLREKDKNDPESTSMWEKFKLREHHINVTFNPPSYFATMREQQIFDLKSNNFQKLTAAELISNSFAQKYYLGLTDEQMAENREWLKKDASLSWEIQNIVSAGPNFRKQMQAMADLENVAQGAGAPVGAVPGGGTALPGDGQLPPEFGPSPDVAAPPEGETPASSKTPDTAPV